MLAYTLILLLLLSLPHSKAAAGAPLDVWRGWLDAERVAASFSRTRSELVTYSQRCGWSAQALVDVHSSHASLRRVIVLDVRHPWNGLGDNLERYVMALRSGRALARATFVLFDGCACSDSTPSRVDPKPSATALATGGGPRTFKRAGVRFIRFV